MVPTKVGCERIDVFEHLYCARPLAVELSSDKVRPLLVRMWRSTLRVPGPFWLGIRTVARLTLYPASSPSCCTCADVAIPDDLFIVLIHCIADLRSARARDVER